MTLPTWICLFFGVSLMTFLAVLVVHRCVILIDKCVNPKLIWKKNYVLERKKRVSSHAWNVCDEVSLNKS